MNIKQLLPYGVIIAFLAVAVYIISGFEIQQRLANIETIQQYIVTQDGAPTGQTLHYERKNYRLYFSWRDISLFSIGAKPSNQRANLTLSAKARASNGN